MPKLPKSFRNLGWGSFTFGEEKEFHTYRRPWRGRQRTARTKTTFYKNVGFYSIGDLMRSIRTGKKLKPESTVKSEQVVFYIDEDSR